MLGRCAWGTRRTALQVHRDTASRDTERRGYDRGVRFVIGRATVVAATALPAIGGRACLVRLRIMTCDT